MNTSLLNAGGRRFPELFLPTYGHYIDGKWTGGESAATIAVINPANLELLAHIQAGTAGDIARAVEAAQRAFKSWGRTHPIVRQEALREIARRTGLIVTTILSRASPWADTRKAASDGRMPTRLCTTTRRPSQ
jgi:hypothetical protein